VQVIDIHAFDAEIFEAAAELVFQKFWRHAMTAGGDILGSKNSRLNVFAEEVFRSKSAGIEPSGVR